MKKKQTDGKTPAGRPKIRVSKSLDKTNTEGWFQDKVDKANHILKTVGLPKGIQL